MAGFSEIPAVEVPMSKWITDLGWVYKDNDDLKRYKRPLANPIIDEILIDKIATIKKEINEKETYYNILADRARTK